VAVDWLIQEVLVLNATQVTDAGLAHLSGLMTLERLTLVATQVTDAGLAHLTGLTGLETLNLSETQVTDAGISELQKALPNCRILS
jgi:internalin A